MKWNHLVLIAAFWASSQCNAATTVVNTLVSLKSAFTAARAGDTVVVANGVYNWGQINLVNANNTSTGAWIVLKAQTRFGVLFNGSTYLQFSGNRILLDGFRFANGNSGTNAVLSFRSSSSSLAYYSRISNVIVDNYNSSDTTENEWVGFYGTNNRLDHCTFINKSNPRATVVVWYSTATFPAQSVSTYHRIDSNYFAGRSYMGSNGGETIRVGVGNNSRTYGYNTIEYNLFENCTQTEPEIVSNKSAYNTYRYNTFKNCNGGLTLRMGKYCSVYGNFFINNDPSKTDSYGIRIIDKGHKVFNNYLEGLLGSSASLSSMRTPIVIYNGYYSSADSLNPLVLNGSYLPADSAIVAFNTIVNCSGGPGIRLGHTDGGLNLYPPKGIVLANNLIKMSSGQAVFNDPSNLTLTYTASGNLFQAPAGLGIAITAGFSNKSLTFGTPVNGILPAPADIMDSAVNSSNYSSLLMNLDIQGQSRLNLFDVGCDELNGTGVVNNRPLDSNWVGAGKPVIIPQAQFINFPALPVKTVGNADFNPSATASSGLTVTYTSSNVNVATIVNGSIHIVGYGSSVITGSQAGNGIYAAAIPVSQNLTVNGLAQTITFPSIPVKTTGTADFSPGATSSSGLLITYVSSNTSVATIVNNMIHVVGAGNAIITASQAGNNTYYPATSVNQTLTVTRTVLYSPSSTVILSGTLSSGVYGNLATNNSSYYVVNSTTSGTRTADWYGAVKITQTPSTVSKLTISYDGKSSTSKTQLLYLYNWSTSSWIQIDSRSVSTSDITITNVQSTPANFISPLGEIRLRVYSSSGTANYSCSGDWMQFAIETSSSAKNSEIIVTDESLSLSEPILFPNPADDYAICNFSLKEESDVSVYMLNSSGMLLCNHSFAEKKVKNFFYRKIYTGNLPNGTYWVKIVTKNGVQSQKLIINHH